jgi:hypothetical protein
MLIGESRAASVVALFYVCQLLPSHWSHKRRIQSNLRDSPRSPRPRQFRVDQAIHQAVDALNDERMAPPLAKLRICHENSFAQGSVMRLRRWVRG